MATLDHVAITTIHQVAITTIHQVAMTTIIQIAMTTIDQVHCGEDLMFSTCRNSVWTNLSEYECSDRNISARSLTIVLDTTTHMGVEISQVSYLKFIEQFLWLIIYYIFSVSN